MSEASMLRRLTERRGVRQFVKFGIVGASGALVNLLVFTLLRIPLTPQQRAAAVSYTVIYSIAFLAGGVSNYFLNRAWTFRATGHAGKQGAQFLTVSVLALVVALAVSGAVAPALGHGHRTWFVGTCAAVVVNFLINKYWTFRDA